MEQMQGVRTIIDRLGLPPRMKVLVEHIEKEFGPLEQLPDAGAEEVRRIRGYVDGENLLAAIVARFVNEVEIEAEALEADAHAMDQRTDFDRWTDAAEGRDELTLLFVPDADYFIAFEPAAERIADAIKEHAIIIGQHTAISLPMANQPTWLTAIADANLDVALVREDPEAEGGYHVERVLDMNVASEPEEGEQLEGGTFSPPESATPTIEQPNQPQVTDTTPAA